ncbi:MAG: hypothetical protein GY811_19800 [Myxococcales bacterium]|nr:hypothetical protein [Myxococcales bacterium]
MTHEFERNGLQAVLEITGREGFGGMQSAMTAPLNEAMRLMPLVQEHKSIFDKQVSSAQHSLGLSYGVDERGIERIKKEADSR